MCSPSRSPLLPPSPSHPSGSSQCTRSERLSHASSLGWWSVSPLIVYLFQCYSLRISHPHLLPQSPKVCSVHLCLFFCFAYRVITFSFFFFFICGGFCHTLKWNSHGFTCVPHPHPPSHLPLHPLPLGFPSAPGLSACLMHPTWAGDLFHPRYCTCFDAVLLKHPTLAFSHSLKDCSINLCLFFSILHIGLSLTSF